LCLRLKKGINNKSGEIDVKLNKISDALRISRLKWQPKSALYSSALVSLLSVSAYAQDAVDVTSETTQQQTSNSKKANITTTSSQPMEIITVGGLRGTMSRSLNEKKNTTAITDGIAAVDFGELPGLSISDLIENISGATGHRLKGSQNEISIRGLGSYWGYSTFNGRTITNAGPGRAVNFKKFPSELVDKVVIYKSQQADLVEGGTSGTIDVTSLNPINFGKSQTTIEATGVYNSYYDDVEGSSPWGNSFVFSTVQNFETEKAGSIGFTLGLTRTDSSNPEENFGGSSQMGVCATRDAQGNELSDNGNDCTNSKSDQAVSAGAIGRDPTPTPESLDMFDESSIFYVPNDAYYRTVSDTDERSGLVATFQWIPNEKWDINVDVERTRLEYDEQRMEFGIDSRRRKLTDHIIADDHTLLYAKGEARPQLTGESRSQLDDYTGYGVNVEHQLTDDFSMALDLSYSESYRYRLRNRTKLRSDTRYQYEMDARTGDIPTLTWLDDNRKGVGDAAYDASQVFDPTDISSFLNDGTAYEEYRRTHEERKDDIMAAKFDTKYLLDNEYFSALKVGVRYSSEHLTDATSNDVSVNLTDGSQVNGATDTADNDWDDNNAAHQALTSGIVDNCSNDHYNGNLFEDAGGGSGQFATYDSKCFIGQMLGQIPSNNGDTSFYDIGERTDGRSGGDVDVTEDIFAAYIMADINTEIAGLPVFGNVGVRMVKTDTHSDGWGDKVYITSNADGTYNADVNSSGEIEAVNLDSSYTEYLPSFNITFVLTPELYLRGAAYRAISRFQMNAMSSGVEYSLCGEDDDGDCELATNTDLTQVVANGSASGNHMDPYLSNNYDLSLEWYPSEDAAVSLAYYYKDFKGGYENVEETRDITVSLDGQDTLYQNVVHSVRQTSDASSVIQGIEITAQKHFTELPYPFDGLGAKVAYNYADSTFVTAEPGSPNIVPDANLFGFSPQVASASVYWEGDWATLRLLYKYRESYFQPNGLPFPDRSNRYVQDSDYLDFSAKFEVNDYLSLSVKALNLLDEPQIMTRGNNTTVADYSRSGPKYFVSAKVKF
jgi:TonB-dependent receptor